MFTSTALMSLFLIKLHRRSSLLFEFTSSTSNSSQHLKPGLYPAPLHEARTAHSYAHCLGVRSNRRCILKLAKGHWLNRKTVKSASSKPLHSTSVVLQTVAMKIAVKILIMMFIFVLKVIEFSNNILVLVSVY